MEELNKNQIILLTLLISFVTSIATGIVTVSLMDQAPTGVSQTVNRVVERTVEKVVPEEPEVTTVVQEVPMVVTEEELIVKAINKVSPSIMALVATVEIEVEPDEEEEETDKTETEIKEIWTNTAFKVKIDNQNLVVSKHFDLEKEIIKLEAVTETGQRFPVKTEKDNGIVVLFLDSSDDELISMWEDIPTLEWSDDSPVIGQTVIGIGSGSSGHQVSVSIVSALMSSGPASAGGGFRTNAATENNIGGSIVNIQGDILGLIWGQQLTINQEALTTLVDSN
ncbi:MAG: hypothetical protein ACOCU8_01520 [Patescibacteria group bacterium]